MDTVDAQDGPELGRDSHSSRLIQEAPGELVSPGSLSHKTNAKLKPSVTQDKTYVQDSDSRIIENPEREPAKLSPLN